MNKLLSIILITIGCIVAVFSITASAEGLVEIRLVDDIDESRGYCLDIAGGRGADAPLDKGLQAHTCYDYTGGVLEDQGFDADLVVQGQFKITYFDVCMVAENIQSDSSLVLAGCENVDAQHFLLQADGHLVTQANPELCVTASSTEKREGRGGSPIHVMRPLSLQPCSDSNSAYQTWTTVSL